MSGRAHIPPLRYHALTRYYEPILRAFFRDGPCIRALVENAALEDGMRVLDLGCGTGRIARAVAARSVLVAIDPDARALDLARSQYPRPPYCRGIAERLPFRDGSFDRVLSALVFHHLTPESKRRALQEARRVLRPGGELHFADFGPPGGVLMALGSAIVLAIDGPRRTAANFQGKLPAMAADAGFDAVALRGGFATACGRLVLYSAVRPPS